MSQIRQKQGVSQGVLFPEIIQLPASEAAVLESILEDLSAVGFDLSPLGGGSYAINGIPSGIEGLNPVELVRNMVHTAMEKEMTLRKRCRQFLHRLGACCGHRLRTSAEQRGNVQSRGQSVCMSIPE